MSSGENNTVERYRAPVSGAIIATRAGLVNIGQEGQLAIGAAFAAYVTTRTSGAGALLAGLAVAAVGGALWAAIAGLLRFWRKVPEVITTLLLVFVAAHPRRPTSDSNTLRTNCARRTGRSGSAGAIPSATAR